MEALSQREFDLWREQDEQFKQEMREALVTHQSLHLSTEGRLSALEATQDQGITKSVNRVTWVSAIISALVGGMFGWLAK